MSKQCLCKSCTCGRHKCPGANDSVSAPFEGHSEYDNNFKFRSLVKTENFKPKLVALNGGKFEGVTESQERYVQHALQKTQPIIPQKNSWQPDSSRFDAKTTNRSDYVQHEVHARPPKPKAVWESPAGEVSNVTTTRADYKAWEVQRIHQREKPKYNGSSAKFEGTSSQREDFQAKEIPPKFVRVKETFVRSVDDRDFMSVTQAAYVPHEAKSQRVSKEQKYQPNSEKLDGVPSYRADYKAWTIERPPPRPPVVAVQTPENRDFGTSNSTSYVTHSNAERAKSFKPLQLPPPPQKFEARTLHETDFQAWPVPPPPKKHEVKYEKNANTFAGASETKAQFTTKWVPKYTREQAKYVPSTIKFEGESTHHTDFAVKPIPTKFVKPKEVFVSAPEERTFYSETKTAYTPKEINICPVLKHTLDRKEKGVDGHIYFHNNGAQQKQESVAVA